MAMREIHGEDDEHFGGKSGPKKDVITPGRIVAAVLVLLFIWWCFTNRQSVNVTLLFTDRSMPLYLLLLIAFAVGLVVGAALWSRRVARKARKRD